MDPLGEFPWVAAQGHVEQSVASDRDGAQAVSIISPSLAGGPAPTVESKPPQRAYDFGGTVTGLVVGYLRKHAPKLLPAILSAADERRSLEELEDSASWSSYTQVRRLCEATAAALGGPAILRRIGESGLDQWGLNPVAGDASLSYGSPAALLRSLPDIATALYPIVETQTEEIGPDDWWIRQRLLSGYEPFPELCALMVGVNSLLPRLFGHLGTEVVEETCQCHGAEWCRIRLSWVSEVDAEARVAQDRKSFQGHLSLLQRTVNELISGEGLASVLPKIVHAAGRAVVAPVHVLSVDLGPGEEATLFWRGADEETARHYVASLGGERASSPPHVLVSEIQSARARYGRLTAFRQPGQRFNPAEREMLETYASLAAAGLDSATALDNARREAGVNKRLFELSAFLVELGTVDEVAQRLADAIPVVIGCDRSIVIVRPHGRHPSTCIAVSGYESDLEAAVREMVQQSPGPFRAPGERELLWHDPNDPASPFGRVAGAIGSKLAVSLPLYLGDQLVGSISADVTDRPSRLRNLPDLAERLQGLAGYAAVGLNNAQLHEELRHQSLHDSLTGLPNRTLILDRIEQMLFRERRHHIGIGLLFVDLDSFKQVNDTYGHDAGDQILRAVAARFTDVVRRNETVGRLGGDEFVVLCEGASLAAGPEAVARRLLDVLKEPFTVRTGDQLHTVNVSASIGIALGQRDEPSVLLRDGDIALYAAKAAGRNRFVVFEPEMQLAVSGHHALETELRQALGAQQFFLVYQPIFELATMKVIGVEALLRWRHPERGVVSPIEFVPILEESGLIDDVGRWVLLEASRQARAWHDAGHKISVSVNISGRTLKEDRLVEDVRHALRTSGLEPGALVIEITETSLMADTDKAMANFDLLRRLGIHLAIDDFGTGYSSLGYLSRFSVDSIKIDRSFIARMTTTPSDEALVQVLIHLAKLLNLRVVAEGIENIGQLTRLRAEGCECGQGFFFAPPMPAETVERCFGGTWGRRSRRQGPA